MSPLTTNYVIIIEKDLGIMESALDLKLKPSNLKTQFYHFIIR